MSGELVGSLLVSDGLLMHLTLALIHCFCWLYFAWVCKLCCRAEVAAVAHAGGDSTMVGIVTYDSSVHFFNVAKGQAMPQMLVMPDVNDVYAPMSSQLLAKLSDCREQLQELLGSIPTMFAAVAGPECCGTAAVEVRRRRLR